MCDLDVIRERGERLLLPTLLGSVKCNISAMAGKKLLKLLQTKVKKPCLNRIMML